MIVASGAGGADGSTNPGPRVPTAVGFGVRLGPVVAGAAAADQHGGRGQRATARSVSARRSSFEWWREVRAPSYRSSAPFRDAVVSESVRQRFVGARGSSFTCAVQRAWPTEGVACPASARPSSPSSVAAAVVRSAQRRVRRSRTGSPRSCTSTSPRRRRGHVRTELGLEYDLLVVSAADAENDDPLFQEGTAAFEDGDAAEQAAALDAHADVGRRLRDRALRRHRRAARPARRRRTAASRSSSATACRTRCCCSTTVPGAGRRARGAQRAVPGLPRATCAAPRRSSPTTSTCSSGSAAPRRAAPVVLHAAVAASSGSGSSSGSAPSTCSPGSTTSCSCWRSSPGRAACARSCWRRRRSRSPTR